VPPKVLVSPRRDTDGVAVGTVVVDAVPVSRLISRLR
jgi:hypothetical protein